MVALETTWRFHSLSAAVSFGSSEDSGVALIRADSVSSVSRRADFARLSLVLLQDRDML